MTSILIECADPWYTYLYNGEKTVEGRKQSSKYKNLKVGDILRFQVNGELLDNKIPKEFYAKICDIKLYSTIREYLQTEGINKCLPGVTEIDEAVNVYTSLMKTTEEEINKVGFMGIHIEVYFD